MTTTSAITTRSLARAFGEHRAVDGIDLDIAPGEIYGFLGPNGAGKSTTVRMLCTLLAPTAGTATVAGHDVATHPHDVRLRIGVALQEAGLSARQTGRETMDLQAKMYGLRGGTLHRRIDEVVDFVGIGDAIDDMVATYSGGMKRRLDLATALVHEPEIVFLDEPTTGLDPDSRQRVWHEVRRLNTELGVTIFLTTQYLEEADQLADRIGIITNGRLAIEGTPDELKRRVGADTVTIDLPDHTPDDVDHIDHIDHVENTAVDGDQITITTTASTDVVTAVLTRLANQNRQAASFAVRGPSLDDVFLDVTGNRLDTTPTSNTGAEP
ncbi:MAG: ATP-binding cassette domain-containing protein [Actinomycetota bacterium]